jgi:5'-nucleotidase
LAITIAHINDTHSHFESASTPLMIECNGQQIKSYVSMGGFARIKTRVNQLQSTAQQQNRPFFFLHAGDCFQGILYFSHFKGAANSSMLNLLGLTAMTLGNHELDMGNDPVRHFLDEINFPLLAGNWNLSQEDKTKKNKIADHTNIYDFDTQSKSANWLTLNVEDEPVALFGVSIDKMADISNPDSDTHFENAVQTVKNTLQRIHETGINKIILLSHLGYEGDKRLAKEVEGLSLIIGGHSHTLQGDFTDFGFDYESEYGEKVGSTHIVQAGYHSLGLGHCDISFGESGLIESFKGSNELLIGRRVCIDASLSKPFDDKLYQSITAKISASKKIVKCQKEPLVESHLRKHFKPAIEAYKGLVLTTLDKPLKQRRLPKDLTDFSTGCEIAPLVARSFYTTLMSRGIALDFAIHNAGGVRKSLDAGPVTQEEIAGKLLPFTVPIGYYQIKGKYLMQLLEGAINNALDEHGTGSGSFPYCHNLKFTYDAESPQGSRIKHLKICLENNWVPALPDSIYRGTSSAYTMKGKEGYDAILKMEAGHKITDASMADCFVSYLDSNPRALADIQTN